MRVRNRFWILFFVTVLLCGCDGRKVNASIDQIFFDGVEEIVLYVQGVENLWDYQEALRCHGMEGQCAEEYAARTPDYMREISESRDEYLKKITSDYNDLKLPLRTDALNDIFRSAALEKFNIQPDVVNSRDALVEYFSKKGVLIVLAKLTIHKDIAPHVAVLNISLHRFDLEMTAVDAFEADFYRKTEIFPLDLSDEQVKQRLSTAIKSSWAQHFPKNP